MHVRFHRSDAVQTGGLTGVYHVEDSVGRGTVGGLLRNGGHGLGHGRWGRGQRGLWPLVGLCDGGRGDVQGVQYSWPMDPQTTEDQFQWDL